jgi:hypothetical protein
MTNLIAFIVSLRPWFHFALFIIFIEHPTKKKPSNFWNVRILRKGRQLQTDPKCLELFWITQKTRGFLGLPPLLPIYDSHHSHKWSPECRLVERRMDEYIGGGGGGCRNIIFCHEVIGAASSHKNDPRSPPQDMHETTWDGLSAFPFPSLQRRYPTFSFFFFPLPGGLEAYLKI